MEENKKTYFTDITENEKRIINLMRAYMTPRGMETEFVDNVVSDLVAELYNKAVRFKAFVTVMEDPNNKNRTPLELISLTNMFTDYLHADKSSRETTSELILSDIVKNLEGELKSMYITKEEGPTTQEALELEKAILDKISN